MCEIEMHFTLITIICKGFAVTFYNSFTITNNL